MEPKKEAQPTTPTDTPPGSGKPTAIPGMDVTPPRPSDQSAVSPALNPATPAPQSVTERLDTPKDPPLEEGATSTELPQPSAGVQKPKKQKASKTPGNGTGKIIFVTILLMITLSALAIYAYSKSNSL